MAHSKILERKKGGYNADVRGRSRFFFFVLSYLMVMSCCVKASENTDFGSEETDPQQRAAQLRKESDELFGASTESQAYGVPRPRFELGIAFDRRPFRMDIGGLRLSDLPNGTGLSVSFDLYFVQRRSYEVGVRGAFLKSDLSVPSTLSLDPTQIWRWEASFMTHWYVLRGLRLEFFAGYFRRAVINTELLPRLQWRGGNVPGIGSKVRWDLLTTNPGQISIELSAVGWGSWVTAGQVARREWLFTTEAVWRIQAKKIFFYPLMYASYGVQETSQGEVTEASIGAGLKFGAQFGK